MYSFPHTSSVVPSMTRRSPRASDERERDDDDRIDARDAYARDISLESGLSRSGTPPIPPLPPAEYEAMIRAQRDLGRAMRVAASSADGESGYGRSDGGGSAAREARTTRAGGVEEIGDGDGAEDSEDFEHERPRAFDGAAVARELMGAYAESDSGSGVTTTSDSARVRAVPSAAAATTATAGAKPPAETRDALERVMVAKPPRGAGRYDSVNADVVEPVKPTTTTNTGRAKVGWVRVNTQGAVNKLSLEKTKIASLLRVPLRDLRVLEPTTADSYSAAVLCRERAIVVNLEQIKVLITSEEVIMTDSQTSTVTHFLPELRNRLLRRKKIRESRSNPSMTINLSAVDLSAMGEPAATTTSKGGAAASQSAPSSTAPTPSDRSPDKPTTSTQGAVPTEEFPFEFVALEVALEMVCNSLEVEANKVELDAKPALEALRKRVDNVNLERVRRMKTRLVRVAGRVSKVREEIQRYLDDDSDMRDMYLTRKAKQESESYAATLDDAAAGATSPAPEGTAHRGGDRATTAAARHRLEHALSVSSVTGRSPLGVHGVHVQGGDAHAAYFDAYDEDKDLQELEDLLETYFTHVDSTHRSLNGLNEYIDDLEDLIEIELDSQRNQLIKLELILTTATLSLTCFSVVVGIFGMNIKNNIENKHDAFLFVAWFGTFATVGMFLLLLRVCRYYKLF